MLFCERCKKRPAMIFVQQMEDGAMKSKGYCLTCAKELGIKPVDDMISQMGLDDETLKGLEEQMQGIMNGDGEDGENGFANMFGGFMGDNAEDDEDGDFEQGVLLQFLLPKTATKTKEKTEKNATSVNFWISIAKISHKRRETARLTIS